MTSYFHHKWAHMLGVLFSFFFLYSACKPSEPATLEQRLKMHVTYLASDDLEGRMTGSPGEQLALEYIRTEFKNIGLDAIDSLRNYLQPFEFTFSRTADSSSHLIVSGANESDTLTLFTEFYPMAYSGNKSFSGEAVHVGYGIHAPDLNYDDYAGINDIHGRVAIIETSSPDGNHPHSKYIKHLDIRTKIDEATSRGATGVIFVNSDPKSHDPDSVITRRIQPTDIPVLFVQDTTLLPGTPFTVNLNIQISEEKRTGHNVLGQINNGKEQTIVIGAHYDHLGYGEQGSLYTGEPAIHNGADDNASGVAVMIELARTLAKDTLKGNNYVFIAFSGEELGLYGSNYFAKNPLFPLEQCNYMLNMDMVGRLDSSGSLIINGIGTSPLLDSIVPNLGVHNLKIKSSESGIGPSDHTSFYLKDIPVAHVFTGTHEDYHKPTDDPDKVNYPGMAMIHDYLISLIGELDDDGKLAFTPTKEAEQKRAPQFNVSLGVIPDYLFDGEGMRIDGVRSGKTAEKAGIKDGDIVIKMGPVEVVDMMSYMKGLSFFQKGDSTDVTVIREGETVTLNVVFE